jgi:hypothetical protein
VKQAPAWESEFALSHGTDPSRLRSVPPPPPGAAPIPGVAPVPHVPAFALDRAADRRIGIARAVLRGSLIGFVLVAAIAWVVARFAGFDGANAVGVAAFAGLWGGPGFGGMMGATLAAGRAAE